MSAGTAAQQSLVAQLTGASEVELLQLQLEQAQEELDAAYERLAQEAKPGSGRGAGAHADTLSVLDTVDAPPHRHLHVDLRNVRIGARRWRSLEVRLLAHHGRPGLAFFSQGSRNEPLAAWRASGDENGREFMLFVPCDHGARTLLTNLGSGDWQTVDGSVDLLVRHLRQVHDERSRHWLSVALRLQSALDTLPPCLRHDGVQMEPDSSAPGWLRVSFVNVDFEGRTLGDLQWRWLAEQERLHWIAPAAGSAVALAQWPVEADGSLKSELPLPVGRTASGQERRRWWSELAERERALVLALFDALANAVRHAPDPAAPASSLLDSASRLRLENRLGKWRLNLRQAARQLLRRRAPGR
jgi:hypothetical protein